MTGYKIVPYKTTLSAAIGDAYGEFQNLRDEMRETADNMESGNLGHTDKAQRCGEAADTLDGFADDEPNIPENVGEMPVTTTQMENKRKGRGNSRDVRCSNAVTLLQAAVDVIETKLETFDKEGLSETEEAEKSDLEELKDALETAAGDAEVVEFPGMFG